MSKEIKVAIIGAGGISDSHANAWNGSGSARVVAVADIRKHLAEEKAARWGNEAKAFASLQEVLNETNPDLIDICTPEHVHKQVALEALNSGKPVFCEKIMATTLTDGLEMLKASESDAVWTGMNYNYHFFPGIRYLKEQVRSGSQGKTTLLNVTTHSFCFHHILEAILWIYGLPHTVWAQGTERDWPEEFHRIFRISPDLIYIPGKAMTARLEYEDGLVCSITSSYIQGLDSLPFHMIAVFENGKALELTGMNWDGDMVGRAVWLPGHEDGDFPAAAFGDRGNGLSFRESMAEAARRFIRGGKAESTWRDGYHVMLVDHALYQAGLRKGPVVIRDLQSELEKKGGA